jgi:DNA-binding MarR family transcriptional regulator
VAQKQPIVGRHMTRFTPEEQRMRDYTDTVVDEWKRLGAELDDPGFAAGIRLLRLGRLVDKAIESEATARGLVVSGDYEVLSCLRRAVPEPLQPAGLAERAMITASGMTGRLDRLEGYGFVERRANPFDRRGIDVHLTDSGKSIADEVFRATAAALSDLMGHLPQADLSTLAELLRTLLTGLGDTPRITTDSLPVDD